MQSREHFFHRFNQVFLIFSLLVGLSLGIYYCLTSTFYYILLGFSSMLFPFLPHLLYRVFKLSPVHGLTTLFYLFSFLLFTVGMAMQGYAYLPLYDKAMHTLSGVFFAFLGVFVFYLLKPVKKIEPRDFSMVCYFSFSFAMTIAAVWEIYEFAISHLLGTDPQGVLKTGVGDTMWDIIVCMMGALLFLIPIWLYYKKGKKDFFFGIFDVFFEKNYPHPCVKS
jgi:uncharacterized membrane protein YjdF